MRRLFGILILGLFVSAGYVLQAQAPLTAADYPAKMKAAAQANGVAHFNAIPWANVSVDGRPQGQTPLGNVTLPVGSHEVTFAHPDFGSVRRTIVVTADRPTRPQLCDRRWLVVDRHQPRRRHPARRADREALADGADRHRAVLRLDGASVSAMRERLRLHQLRTV